MVMIAQIYRTSTHGALESINCNIKAFSLILSAVGLVDLIISGLDTHAAAYSGTWIEKISYFQQIVHHCDFHSVASGEFSILNFRLVDRLCKKEGGSSVVSHHHINIFVGCMSRIF